MSPRRRPPLTANPVRPPESVPAEDRLSAKEIAQREKCSPKTAGAMMRALNFGPVYGRNSRVRWVDRLAYERWLAQLAPVAPCPPSPP